MSSPAVTVSADASAARAARLMADHGIERLPVAGVGGELVGIISRADLIEIFLVPDCRIRWQVIADVIKRTLWQDPAGIQVEVSDGIVTLRAVASSPRALSPSQSP
jgi:CBS domain-containing protein